MTSTTTPKTLILLLILVVFTTSRCEFDPDRAGAATTSTADTVDDTTDAGDEDTTLPEGVPSYDDDEAIIAYSDAILASCTEVSSMTIPSGWTQHLVGTTGCSIYAPAGWVSALIPYETYGQLYLSDEEDTSGYTILFGSLPGTTWTAADISSFIFQGLAQTTPDIEIISTIEAPDGYGLGLTIRVDGYKATVDGVPTVGSFRVIHQPCSGILGTCPLTAMGTFAPLETLDELACTLAQIDATLQCPTGGTGYCQETQCSLSCTNEGKSFGYCSNDVCICVE